MATFVHNEPSALAVIQEAQLPETFYTAIERGLEPAIEVRNYFDTVYTYLNGIIHLGHAGCCQCGWGPVP